MKLKTGYHIITSPNELPCPKSISNLYMDFETKNVFGQIPDGTPETEERFRKGEGGMYPFGGDRMCGIAVTFDDCKDGFYIPVRHVFGKNIDLGVVRSWLQDTLNRSTNWINHNVVFDATFAHFEGVSVECNLIDTYALSRIHDSDRFDFGLKPLTEEWLGYSMESSDAVKDYLKAVKSKDWSVVPIDILGEYAIDDVFRNRELYAFLLNNKDEQLDKVWGIEISLSSVLFDMEVEGLRIDRLQCKKESLFALRKVIDSATILSEQLGEEFRDSTQCIYELLINRLKLPVVATIKEKDSRGREVDTGRPSFDKNALAIYRVHPNVVGNAVAEEVVKNVSTYREETQFLSLYAQPFLGLADKDDRIHPKYNPIVRTGRMSCSRPNIQQQNARSKKLILADDGCGFISKDYSQIEFRLICHYINDLQAIDAYTKNPDTDFHQWVADLLHVKRGPGKRMNFGMAYGAGKKRVTLGLASDPDIIAEIGELVRDVDIEKRHDVFNRKCSERAAEVYDLYHERLPGIKSTAYRASDICKFRGFVFNAYGRRRHLPRNAAHKAFNSIIQGSAMDIMKEAMIRLSPRFNETSRKYGLKLRANVHDEILISCPLELLEDPEVHSHIDGILENPSIPFRVPIRTDTGISAKNWAEAKS